MRDLYMKNGQVSPTIQRSVIIPRKLIVLSCNNIYNIIYVVASAN
jgi:hypothetical protein